MTYSRERHIFQSTIRSRAHHSARKGTGLAHLKIQVLEERLRLQRIQKYGPGSEKLSVRSSACWNYEPE